ncbi:hypothetical protein QUB68_25560 [Microcoleus sp. A006_D1]|uniref:hypothetical protein n=1 Tax=Microcoleus sp. A006_D1 TaxID=3055267 RepID=UPI002FD644A8
MLNFNQEWLVRKLACRVRELEEMELHLKRGDLTGMTRQEVDDFLRGQGAEAKITRDGYIQYKFLDKSTVMIRPNGEAIRTPAPKYGSDGRNINKGLRLDRDGSLLRTRDEFGNFIPDTHNTGEKLNE